RLQSLEDRYNKLNELLSDPEVISDTEKLREYSKEQADLEEVVQKYREYKKVTTELKDAQAMLADDLDDEMEEMVKEEIGELSERKDQLEEEMKLLLLRKIRMMKRTSLWKFAQPLVETRQACLLVIYIGCTRSLPKITD